MKPFRNLLFFLFCIGYMNHFGQTIDGLMNGFTNEVSRSHFEFSENYHVQYYPPIDFTNPNQTPEARDGVLGHSTEDYKTIKLIDVESSWIGPIKTLVKNDPSVLNPYLASDDHDFATTLLLMYIFEGELDTPEEVATFHRFIYDRYRPEGEAPFDLNEFWNPVKINLIIRVIEKINLDYPLVKRLEYCPSEISTIRDELLAKEITSENLDNFHNTYPSFLMEDLMKEVEILFPEYNNINLDEKRIGGNVSLCGTITIGNGEHQYSFLDVAVSVYPWALYHLYNNSKNRELFQRILSDELDENQFLEELYKIEAEAKIISEEIKRQVAQKMYSCIKKSSLKLENIESPKYPNMSLVEIQNKIRTNGTLELETNFIRENGVVSSTGVSGTLKKLIKHYSTEYKSVNNEILIKRNEGKSNEQILSEIINQSCN